MRTRNIKINVYLNEDEKKRLEEKSSNTKLSQSDFIRKLISKYTENIINQNDIEDISNELSQISTNLTQLAKHLHWIGNWKEEETLNYEIDNVNYLVPKIHKIISKKQELIK